MKENFVYLKKIVENFNLIPIHYLEEYGNIMIKSKEVDFSGFYIAGLLNFSISGKIQIFGFLEL